MKQNSSQISKFLFIAAAIAVVIAIVFYMKGGIELKQIGFEDAKEIALEEDKPIILYFYSRYNQVSKQLNATFMKDDSVTQKLNSEFVFAVESVNNSEEREAMEEKFGLEGIPAYYFYNPEGKLMLKTHGNNSIQVFMAAISREFIPEILKFKSYETVIKNSRDSGKYPFVLVISSPRNSQFDNIFNRLYPMFEKEENFQYLVDNYEPTILFSNNDDDLAIIKRLNSKVDNQIDIINTTVNGENITRLDGNYYFVLTGDEDVRKFREIVYPKEDKFDLEKDVKSGQMTEEQGEE
jgi:hypothetical protein